MMQKPDNTSTNTIDAMENAKASKKKPALNYRNATAIKNLLDRGIAVNEIAKIVGIKPDTIYNYFRKDPRYREIHKNSGVIDSLVAALYKRAWGFHEETEKAFCYNGKIIKTTVKEYYPPDTAALCFALSNRRPEDWQNRRYVDNQVSGKFVMEHTTKKSIDDRYNRYKHLLAARDTKRIAAN